MNTPIIEQTEGAHVELRNEACWIDMSIVLAEEFTGGHVARFGPGVKMAIEAADESASNCRQSHWLSGIESGAFYAFRTLKAVRRVLWITNLTACLRAGDTTGLAIAAARATALSLHRDLPLTDMEGWQFQPAEPSTNGQQPAASIAPATVPSALAK